MSAISLQLDGRAHTYTGEPERSLLTWLREDLGVTLVKDGCSGQGFCRACTVEIDGRARLACVTPMKRLDGASVTTLAGFPAEVRDILAEAFVRHGAVQCGFCTPGYLARTRALLAENPNPTREEAVKRLRHHVCRCTGYHAIVDAVLDAAAVLRGETTPPPMDEAGVGRSQRKFRARAKALGEDPFVDDLRFPGMLHGALRYSDHPRAIVRSIDTTAAAAMPGVVRIFLASDVPGARHTGLIAKDWPLLVAAGETTRYVGDVLAHVVAETEAQARAAVAAIEVDYEVLEPLSDPHEALTSPVHIHEGGNLYEQSVVQRGGDVEAALAASAHVARGVFTTQRIEHAFLETEAAVARPWPTGGPDVGIELYSSGQGVYVDRVQIAALLGLELAQVKVNQVATGGAFGGKEDLSAQGHAALAAYLLGETVKVKLDRADSIRMHPKRHPIWMDYALGCDAGGRLTALKARFVGDTGAYASVGGKVLERAAGHATGAYHVPCVDLVARAVYTNNLPCGAMRGFGANQATFAMESCLDDLCEMGGFDRWQIRWDNALTAGRMTATGQVLDEGAGVRPTLEAVREAYEGAGTVGIACGIKNCGVGNGMTDWCEVHVDIVAADRVVVRHGWTEMGQGVHTVAQQILHEETGIAPALIDVVVSTADEAEAGMTTSSRGTSLLGNSLLIAARKLAAALETASLAELVGESFRGLWKFEGSTAPGASGEVVTHYSYSYATQLVFLDDTGRLARVVAAHDAGRIINPTLFRGQIQGSVHMGLGYALSEDLPQEGAQLPSTKMKDLGLLRMDETPPIEVIGVEVRDPLGPYGAKGVGEVGLVPTAGAVAGALRAFDGVRRMSLPLARPSHQQSTATAATRAASGPARSGSTRRSSATPPSTLCRKTSNPHDYRRPRHNPGENSGPAPVEEKR